MTTTAMTFAFEGKGVRFVGTPEKPEWIAQDVCACLGLSNHRQALKAVPADEKGVTLRDTPGGVQQIRTVYEPGLYRLIFKSEKPEAERFKKCSRRGRSSRCPSDGSSGGPPRRPIDRVARGAVRRLPLAARPRAESSPLGARLRPQRKLLEKQAGLGQTQTSLSFERDPVNRLSGN